MVAGADGDTLGISIHAPREGSDERPGFAPGDVVISIHAPREGSDVEQPGRVQDPLQDFYPRSPRGERPANTWARAGQTAISIHAPREGSDPGRCPQPVRRSAFLSTLPARGATQQFGGILDAYTISIHAPREGSDASSALSGIADAKDFYPRSPRGERLAGHVRAGAHGHISIHAPREGSDQAIPTLVANIPISIHAPREGSDGPRRCRSPG